MRFSVIMPVYNVKDYIGKCLQSILDQDFSDYEIVVVDDESPDSSMQIVEEFAKAYPQRFQIIHQKNKGQGGARNTGAAQARGEYLIFIDSDDYIAKGMFHAIDERLSLTPCDVLMFNSIEVLPNGKEIGRLTWFPEDRICETAEEKISPILASPAPWNKVCRRQFYVESGFTFPEKMIYEDVATRILLAKAERIVLCKEHFYRYVHRQGSTMNSGVSSRVLDIIKVVDFVYDICAQETVAESCKEPLEAALVHSTFHIAENVYQQDKTSPMLKTLMDYLKTRFPNYGDNPVLDSSTKMEIAFLLQGNYLQYDRSKRIREYKRKLSQMPIISWLYLLRRRIKR